MRTPTDYRYLENRCAACGHRRAMHTAKGDCLVVNGQENNPSTLVPCKCRKFARTQIVSVTNFKVTATEIQKHRD